MDPQTLNRPFVLISESLLEEGARQEIWGLRCLTFRVGASGDVVFVDQAPSLSSDILVALAASAEEKTSLEKALMALERPFPQPVLSPTRAAVIDRIGEALAARVEAHARRESTFLREWRYGHDAAAFVLAPQGLAPVRLDELADPPAYIVYNSPFEMVFSTQVGVRGLAAIALNISSQDLGVQDRLEVSLVGDENRETLGAWRVPAEAIGNRREWLTLDLAISLAAVEQNASVRLRGHISPGGTLRFSKSAEEMQEPALRLYVARGPRLAASPFWIWPGADARPTAPAVSLSGVSWLGARLLGEAAELPSASGDKRIGVAGGAGATLIFPDVSLHESAALAARVSREGADELEVALSLLPPDFEIGDGHAKAEKSAIAWSMSQILKGEASAITLVIPADAPRDAHVAISVRNLGPQGDQTTILRCESVWLVPRRLRRPKRTFVTEFDRMIGRAATFEEVRLDDVFANESWRHLDLSVTALSISGRMWLRVKFKFFEENGEVGLEFRLGEGFPLCFSTWPGTSSDSYGPYFKISGPSGLEEAKLAFTFENDRLLLTAVEEALPSLIAKLGETGQLGEEDRERWLTLVNSLCQSSEEVSRY